MTIKHKANFSQLRAHASGSKVVVQLKSQALVKATPKLAFVEAVDDMGDTMKILSYAEGMANLQKLTPGKALVYCC